MASPGHPNGPSRNPPSFPNARRVITRSYLPSQNASGNPLDQEPDSQFYDPTYRPRPSPPTVGNNSFRTRNANGPPTVDRRLPLPADLGHYNTDPNAQRNTIYPPNRQSNSQSFASRLVNEQTRNFAVANQGESFYQSEYIIEHFDGTQAYDTLLNSRPALTGSYEPPRSMMFHGTGPSPHYQAIDFIQEDPANPRNATVLRRKENEIHSKRAKESPQGHEIQKNAKRSHKKELDSIGGACLRCHRIAKGCDLNVSCNLCERQGLVCVRGFEKLWLYGVYTSPNGVSPVRRSQQTIISDARKRTFPRIDVVIRELVSEIIPDSCDRQAVLDFRWNRSDPTSPIPLNTTLLTEFPGIAALPNTLYGSLVTPLLNTMPTPKFPHLSNVKKSSILSAAVSILQKLSLIISISRASFYAIPRHVFPGRATLVFLLAYLAKTIAEESAQFTSNLIQHLRRKQDGKQIKRPYDVWLAIGIYHRVVKSFSEFEPPSMITEIFAEMKIGLMVVCAAIKDSLQNAYRSEFGDLVTRSQDEGPSDAQGIWKSFRGHIQLQPNPRSLEVAFYFSSTVTTLCADIRAEAPTVTAWQYAPFEPTPTAVSQLLKKAFQNCSVLPFYGFFEAPAVPHALTEANLKSLTTPLVHSPVHESISLRHGSNRTAELCSLRSFVQGTEMPDLSGFDETCSTVREVADYSNEENQPVQEPMDSIPDHHFLGSHFEYVYWEIYGGYKRNRSQASSSNQSRRDRNKQHCFREDYETNVTSMTCT